MIVADGSYIVEGVLIDVSLTEDQTIVESSSQQDWTEDSSVTRMPSDSNIT